MPYESESFKNETELLPGNPGLCGNRTSSRPDIFETVVDGLLSSLSIATPKINGFYAAVTSPINGTNTSTAYAIAQCVETIPPDACRSCLEVAYADIRSCISSGNDGRAVDSACFMRYSDTAFFRNNQTIDIIPFLGDGSSSNKGAVVGGIVGGGVIIILLILVLVWWYRRSKRSTPGGILNGAKELQGPNYYSYSDLKNATQDFSDENKLGEGGFGDVYKATLDGEEIVAVKKLKVGFGRAKVGFENEILLISRIHHRNLLRLLGWASEGSNLLLVLEYMSNGSLDRFLWGEKRGTLNWKRRHDIILGIARGLTHLHKEIHVKIVHRDIKSSNILLDNDFQPKIADFGLARFQPEDQTHVVTKFAGTLGYTAPEYLLYGILSDKVDTFSFGIVILEIISSQKCTYRNFDGPSTDCLLEYAWKLYETKNLMKLIDETMDLSKEEEKHIMEVIEIALLCTQSPVSKRPTMPEVILMLSNDPSLGERQLARPNFTEYSRRIRIG
ncbi:hypothetical protein QVD17_23859 [Tagetes erecta]|uniref:Uncharacterized protein n=1 Tax=Tagetes erecta TaxID=13708 RepID=A0AAD8KF18_TARER|nr:hypothetical protein QVD17_23859 [Tagetes erecta]